MDSVVLPFLFLLIFVFLIFQRIRRRRKTPEELDKFRLMANYCDRYMLALKNVLSPTNVIVGTKCGVLVLDVVEGYQNIFSQQSILRINEIVQKASTNNCPVVFTRWSRDGTDNDLLDQKKLVAYNLKAEKSNLIASLEIPGCAQIVRTKHTNAMANKQIDESFRFCDTVIVCGSWTCACVKTTCESLIAQDKQALVPKGAVVDLSTLLSFMSLVAIQATSGKVVDKIEFS